MGPRAGRDRCGKSRLHQDSIPDRPAYSSVAIPTELPGPLHLCPSSFICTLPTLFVPVIDLDPEWLLNSQKIGALRTIMSVPVWGVGGV